MYPLYYLSQFLNNLLCLYKSDHSLSKKIGLTIQYSYILLLLFLELLKIKTTRKIILFDLKVFFPDLESFYYLYGEIFIKNEYFISKYKTQNPRTIIDAGANIGLATLFFLHNNKNAFLISIEADPNTFRYLKKNIEINNFSHRVQLLNVVLSRSSAKTLNFYSSGRLGGLMSSLNQKRSNGKKIIVENKKLSLITKKYEKIDVLKLDVEGAETEILDDLNMSKELQKIDSFLIEYHHNLNTETKLSNFLSVLEINFITYQIIASIEKYQPDFFQDILILGSKNKLRE